jgi:5'-methylthioadenosine phosphorylase
MGGCKGSLIHIISGKSRNYKKASAMRPFLLTKEQQNYSLEWRAKRDDDDMNKAAAKLGIIGGSGLYELPLKNKQSIAIPSPWGESSSPLITGTLGNTELVFLPRHGAGHRFSPSGINYRANIDVLKRAGVTDLICFSAVGSYQQHLPPGTFMLPDQIIDRTYKRESSFFGNGCVAHVPFAHPVGPKLADHVEAAIKAEKIAFQRGGTAVCMEGPQFSTQAESLAYKAQAFDIIGMTSMPEAKLAREAEITYCMVAMVTDFDAWHPSHDHVDVTMVVKQMQQNTKAAKRLIERIARHFPEMREECPVGSHHALDGAIMTAPSARDSHLLAKLDAVAGRVLK